MFGIPAWVPITVGALVALLAFVVLGAVILAGKQHTPSPPRHQRTPGNHPRITRDDWLNGTRVIRRAEVTGAPPWTVRDDPGATVIEGPWGAPVRQYGTRLEVVGRLPDPGAGPVEYLPAPELLDDLPPAPEPMRLDGCSCVPVAGAHRPPCAWAAQSWRPAAELDEGTDQDAFGLCGCMCLCWDGADGPDNMCSRCRAGNHAPRQTDDDDPGWVTRIRAELDEDQAAELDEPDPFGPVPIDDQAAKPDEPDNGPAAMRRFMREHPLPAPEIVLAEQAHAAQLRELDADARAFMAGKAAEFAELRRSLTGPGR